MFLYRLLKVSKSNIFNFSLHCVPYKMLSKVVAARGFLFVQGWAYGTLMLPFWPRQSHLFHKTSISWHFWLEQAGSGTILQKLKSGCFFQMSPRAKFHTSWLSKVAKYLVRDMSWTKWKCEKTWKAAKTLQLLTKVTGSRGEEKGLECNEFSFNRSGDKSIKRSLDIERPSIERSTVSPSLCDSSEFLWKKPHLVVWLPLSIVLVICCPV